MGGRGGSGVDFDIPFPRPLQIFLFFTLSKIGGQPHLKIRGSGVAEREPTLQQNTHQGPRTMNPDSIASVEAEIKRREQKMEDLSRRHFMLTRTDVKTGNKRKTIKQLEAAIALNQKRYHKAHRRLKELKILQRDQKNRAFDEMVSNA